MGCFMSFRLAFYAMRNLPEHARVVPYTLHVRLDVII